MTAEQMLVVNSRIKDGYCLIGKSVSIVNGLPLYLLLRSKHLLAINSLGYDEHFVGVSWKIKE